MSDVQPVMPVPGEPLLFVTVSGAICETPRLIVRVQEMRVRRIVSSTEFETGSNMHNARHLFPRVRTSVHALSATYDTFCVCRPNEEAEAIRVMRLAVIEGIQEELGRLQRLMAQAQTALRLYSEGVPADTHRSTLVGWQP